MKVNNREGLGQPRVTEGQDFELIFSNEKCVFLSQFDIRIPKGVIFISVRGLGMLKVAV